MALTVVDTAADPSASFRDPKLSSHDPPSDIQNKPSSSTTGFTKRSNSLFFLATAGVFSVFSAVHLIFLDQHGKWGTPLFAQEKIWFLEGIMHWSNQIHMWSVIPAGIFLPLQFLPRMRQQYITLHMILGRILFILLGIGCLTGGTMGKRSFGGSVDTITYATIVPILCGYGIYKAWTSIRRLEIDQHRIWVLRTWMCAGSIFTLRICITIINLTATQVSGSLKTVFSCAEIENILHVQYDSVRLQHALVSMYQRYPACVDPPTAPMDTFVVVKATMLTGSYPEEIAGFFNSAFGASGLLGLIINILAVESYLHFTEDENERLKRLSVTRRKAAGL